MSHETDRTRHILPKLSKGNYNILMKLISNSLTFSVSDAAKFRLHVLDHYYRHGMKSTCHAFNLPRATIYVWKKRFELSRKKLSSLIPKSTRPTNLRQMTLNLKMLEFIKSMRIEYGNLSKYKIKPFLDEYARKNNLPMYGTTKIGLIIKRRKYFFDTSKKQTKRRRVLTPRLRRSPKETLPGYIEMDSIILYVLGRKYCFITAIDVVTKFAWVKLTTNLSSRQAKLAFIEFKNQYKYKLRIVQTDNGSEFLKEFDLYLSQIQIKHEFIYQKMPKINGVIERFNRTIQEEFIERNDDLIITNTEKFTQKLYSYLIWYNTKRPHYSLGQISPTEYMHKFG
jgi:transposase InsO family protein